jgi:multimeric flavodoxin WrbA
MNKKIVIVSGSRNPEGRTARALNAVSEGAREQGVSTEIIFLTDFKIEMCRQCEMSGFGICLERGDCVIDDDVQGIVEKIRKADLVVFGTPVYWGDLSENLKTFLDRLRRICLHEDGRLGIESKPAVGICMAGGGGGGAPQCCAILERILKNRFDVIDMISVRRQNLETKLEQLKIAGRWLASIPSSDGDQ